MNDKAMTDVEFKALEKLYEEDLLNYNQDIPLLFDEIRRLRANYGELAKIVDAMLHSGPYQSVPVYLLGQAAESIEAIKKAKP